MNSTINRRITAALESAATFASSPVPTIGSSGFIKNALSCILEPIKALFASSCSKNGIKDAATDKFGWGHHLYIEPSV